jgi:hypothetical protein
MTHYSSAALFFCLIRVASAWQRGEVLTGFRNTNESKFRRSSLLKQLILEQKVLISRAAKVPNRWVGIQELSLLFIIRHPRQVLAFISIPILSYS